MSNRAERKARAKAEELMLDGGVSQSSIEAFMARPPEERFAKRQQLRAAIKGPIAIALLPMLSLIVAALYALVAVWVTRDGSGLPITVATWLLAGTLGGAIWLFKLIRRLAFLEATLLAVEDALRDEREAAADAASERRHAELMEVLRAVSEIKGRGEEPPQPDSPAR